MHGTLQPVSKYHYIIFAQELLLEYSMDFVWLMTAN